MHVSTSPLLLEKDTLLNLAGPELYLQTELNVLPDRAAYAVNGGADLSDTLNLLTDLTAGATAGGIISGGVSAGLSCIVGAAFSGPAGCAGGALASGIASTGGGASAGFSTTLSHTLAH